MAPVNNRDAVRLGDANHVHDAVAGEIARRRNLLRSTERDPGLGFHAGHSDEDVVQEFDRIHDDNGEVFQNRGRRNGRVVHQRGDSDLVVEGRVQRVGLEHHHDLIRTGNQQVNDARVRRACQRIDRDFRREREDLFDDAGGRRDGHRGDKVVGIGRGHLARENDATVAQFGH